MLEPVTKYLFDDEPCFQLTEIDLAPEKGEIHRYRTFFVMRGDKITKFIEDMGPSKNQKADQCRILGGVIDDVTGRIEIFHKVGELRDIAEGLRAKPQFDKLELARVDRIKA